MRVINKMNLRGMKMHLDMRRMRYGLLHNNSDEAFDYAIFAKQLTNNPDDTNFAGKYMYMHSTEEFYEDDSVRTTDHFKNKTTREYDVTASRVRDKFGRIM